MADPGLPYTAEEIDDALTALIAFAGNASGAKKYLESVGKRAPTGPTLKEWSRVKYWARYEELREKFAEQNAKTLENNFLDAARYATETAMLAVDRARERLENDKDDDPGRTAANLSRVAQSATDKRATLQGVPRLQAENQNLNALLRGMVARFPQVISLAEEPKGIGEAAVATDERD